MKPIYVPPSVVDDIRQNGSDAYVVTKIPYFNFEISISIREKVGFREIRVYDLNDKSKDVTDRVFKDCGLYQHASAENLKIAISWIEHNQYIV